MSQGLCSRGAELFKTAAAADEIFKSSLIRFFSNSRKDEREMQQLEALGEGHREADEAFYRHQKFCEICAGIPTTVLRYATAE
ncbi:MAG TPA: hypothetical protein VE133_09655 [Candidatus Sulfotelmatobacter sp.]|jgi:hypothetical protein|nr:hypothetical protein [Candidatus Sulfotelmatobacter sp.]